MHTPSSSHPTRKGVRGKNKEKGFGKEREDKKNCLTAIIIQSHGYFTVDWEKKESQNVERGVGAGWNIKLTGGLKLRRTKTIKVLTLKQDW